MNKISKIMGFFLAILLCFNLSVLAEDEANPQGIDIIEYNVEENSFHTVYYPINEHQLPGTVIENSDGSYTRYQPAYGISEEKGAVVSSRGLSSVSDVTVTPYKNIVCCLDTTLTLKKILQEALILGMGERGSMCIVTCF